MDRMPELVTVSNTRWRRDPTQPTRRTSTGLTGPLGYGALPQQPAHHEAQPDSTCTG
jgi:hypothetical protein